MCIRDRERIIGDSRPKFSVPIFFRRECCRVDELRYVKAEGGIMIRLKRAYEPPGERDGTRFLVDHLWPRGLKKEEVQVKSWIKTVSPSNELRQWFGHDPAKWKEFQRRYVAEMNKRPESWQPL